MKTSLSKIVRKAISKDPEEIKRLYIDGKHKELARILPHIRDINNIFIQSLVNSRLMVMGENLIELKPITLGADPEFILKDTTTGEIVLFSSELVNFSYSGMRMSEASLGADYGLLEIRPKESTTIDGLLNNIADILRLFDGTYDNLTIYETEAVSFDHKKERIRSLISNDKIDFGVNIRKLQPVNAADISIDDETSYVNTSLSAYDEPLMFLERTDLLTAGGHIHIGGTFVRMLSFEQLKQLIKEIDEKVYDLCIGVETKAGVLRREAYGNRGEFRIKPYGVEYRTPSNAIFWPKNATVLRTVLETIYDTTKTFLIV
jgi:hypothetical protein